ncbi:GFA family protein [Sphingopyxis sp.]|uniref:GFA family protein n=1 Tax=Sphingopyxis sp. TaxID=1908224 RepID=UPI001D400363|nr:GFA family protein [Sphingopyxis sp.]MBW8296115.1 GFA family protein [Sphingopyxis sp.]
MSELNPDAIYTGACLCGAVRIKAIGEPDSIVACHCNSCRRHTGGPCAVFADYAVESVIFTAEKPVIFSSSPGVTRGFCKKCGSTISYQGENLPDMIHLHVGVFDAPRSFWPQAEEQMDEGMPWVSVSLKRP